MKNKKNKEIINMKLDTDKNLKSDINITLVKSEKENSLLKRIKKNKNDKIDGYILYKGNNKQYKLIPINNFKDVYKYKEKAHILHKIEGILEGKPFYMIDNKYPINLNSDIKSNLTDKNSNEYKNGVDLCYDANVFYTALDYINISNLSHKEDKDGFNLFTLLKEYWHIIVAVIVFVIIVLLQNSGKIKI